MNKKRMTFSIIIGVIIIASSSLIITRKVMELKSKDNTIYTVRTEKFEDVIDIAGTVSAADEQTLQAQSDGSVTAVYVKEGDFVKKGDVILQLDDTTQQYNLANEDYLIAQKKVNGSAKEIELMQKQRDSLLQKVLERKVVATFDGVLAELNASVGDYFEAKDTIGTLVDLSYLKATVEVAETDVSRLFPGQKVKFNFPAYKEGTVEGYLVSYPSIGEITTRGVTVVKAEVRIDDYPKVILPNYSFSGEIEINESQTFLVVERNAIGYENGIAFVEVKTDNGFTRKDVTVKPYGSNFVRIIDGLSGNEELKALSNNSISGRLKNEGSQSQKNSNNNQTGNTPPSGFYGMR